MTDQDTAISLYNEFIEFRDRFVHLESKNAIFTDHNDSQKIRSLVQLKDLNRLNHIKAQIAKWTDYAEKLMALDPIRFGEGTQPIYPIPKIIYNAVSLSVRLNTAVSTRLVSKDSILRRSRALLSRELKAHPDGSIITRKLREEIAFFEKDYASDYRIRSTGYRDVILFVKHPTIGRVQKIRIPYCGLFYYDPKNDIPLKLPAERRLQEQRVDSLNNYLLEPIQSSLPFGGYLYRESDMIAAKEACKNAQERYERDKLAAQ